MTKYLKTKEGSIEDVAKQMQNKVLESDYQDKFKKELDKAGKPLGQMTGAEKKSFFNKIDKMHKGKNENAMSVADVDRMKKQGMKPAKEGFASDAQRKAAFASGYKEKGKDKKEDLDSKDKPAVTKVIGQLKKAVAAHSGQVKDLEKAMKTESVNETHTTQTAKANAQQRAAGGEKSPISLMKNKSIDEITANNGKTFAQMRAEIDEACWDSHKQVGTKMKGGKRVPNCVPKNEDTSYPSKDDKIKGDNPADKGEKEQQAGEDTREPKKKTMSGKIATTPEMNPKVDYKY
tara:strand:- start:394 stop:1263 length:870 start_codon:yes stop_codon:yes gene_type:complete